MDNKIPIQAIPNVNFAASIYVGVYILTNSKSIGSPSFLLSYQHQAYLKLITSYDKTTELMTTKHLNIKARHRSSLRNSPPNEMHLIKTDETF